MGDRTLENFVALHLRLVSATFAAQRGILPMFVGEDANGKPTLIQLGPYSGPPEGEAKFRAEIARVVRDQFKQLGVVHYIFIGEGTYLEGAPGEQLAKEQLGTDPRTKDCVMMVAESETEVIHFRLEIDRSDANHPKVKDPTLLPPGTQVPFSGLLRPERLN